MERHLNALDKNSEKVAEHSGHIESTIGQMTKYMQLMEQRMARLESMDESFIKLMKEFVAFSKDFNDFNRNLTEFQQYVYDSVALLIDIISNGEIDGGEDHQGGSEVTPLNLWRLGPKRYKQLKNDQIFPGETAFESALSIEDAFLRLATPSVTPPMDDKIVLKDPVFGIPYRPFDLVRAVDRPLELPGQDFAYEVDYLFMPLPERVDIDPGLYPRIGWRCSGKWAIEGEEFNFNCSLINDQKHFTLEIFELEIFGVRLKSKNLTQINASYRLKIDQGDYKKLQKALVDQLQDVNSKNNKKMLRDGFKDFYKYLPIKMTLNLIFSKSNVIFGDYFKAFVEAWLEKKRPLSKSEDGVTPGASKP